jgi:hypothetical protein
MDKVKAILYLYPDANPLMDFIIQDDSDGNGPYIAQWNVKDADGNDVTEPTDEELTAAWDELQALPPVPQKPTLEQQISELQDAFNAFLMG